MLIKKGKSPLFIDNNMVYKVNLLEDGITIIKYFIDENNNLMIKSLYTYPLTWVFEKCGIPTFDEFCEKFTGELCQYIEICAIKEDKIYYEEYSTAPFVTDYKKCDAKSLLNIK